MSMDEVERAMESTFDDITMAAKPEHKITPGVNALGPGPIIHTGSAESKDPWIHRSETMLCRTCMFFVPKELSAPQLASPIGRCRRRAPTMNGYPVVFPTDWCGDHKLDENRV